MKAAIRVTPYVLFVMYNGSMMLLSHNEFSDIRIYSFVVSFIYTNSMFIIIFTSELSAIRYMICILISVIMMIISVEMDQETPNNYMRFLVVPSLIISIISWGLFKQTIM